MTPRKAKPRKAREKHHPIHRHLPPPSDTNFDKGESSKPGEPMIPMLYSYVNDKSMRAKIEIVCCDCGLVHLYTFEVFKASDKNWYIAKRAYRSEIATTLERKNNRYKCREVVVPKKKRGR